MFFVWMGRLATALLLLHGGVLTVVGFIYASSNDQAGFARHFPSKTTGEAIDRGLESILFAIIVGLLCYIADQLRRAPVAPAE